MTSQRIIDFLAHECPRSPCLVVDLEIVADKFRKFQEILPDTPVFYAIKANPALDILTKLNDLGSSFDAASVAEIELALKAGAGPDRISYGNTIKKEGDIARAFVLGIKVFAVDSLGEVEKIARAAPGSRIYCRLLTDGRGANWSLSRKFGCTPEMALDVLLRAEALGLKACGLSFHAGSQQTDTGAFGRGIDTVAAVFGAAKSAGLDLSLINLGGGFPARYRHDIPCISEFATEISSALQNHFGKRPPQTLVEPGRGLVGEAGTIRSEVVLVSKKSKSDTTRWVYLDIGRFGGLAETMDEAIRYPISSRHDGGPTGPCIVAGPTCDAVDILYEKKPYDLPLGLKAGDQVMIGSTGAYTASYASVGFNGIAPLPTYVI